jgi:hypothetical protein
MMSQAIRSGRMSGSSRSTNSNEDDLDDILVGHCALSLEQLCKVAASNAGGDSCTVSATRMLVNRGRPMYCIDPSTMQVIVEYTCIIIQYLAMITNLYLINLPYLIILFVHIL